MASVGALGLSQGLLQSGIARASSLLALVNYGDISLPPGFRYVKFSSWGDLMSNGNATPFIHDRMATFPGPHGTIRLVRNQ